MATSYSERLVDSQDGAWLGRCKAAAKERAMMVMIEPQGPNNKARWAFAQQLLRDQIPWPQVSDAIVADGTTTIGCDDATLAARCAVVFDTLVGPLSYQPPAS